FNNHIHPLQKTVCLLNTDSAASAMSSANTKKMSKIEYDYKYGREKETMCSSKKNDTSKEKYSSGKKGSCKKKAQFNWYCPVLICGKIKEGSNPVHCVAPECKDDPHHVKYNGKTYWCPVCKIHSKS